MNQKKIELIVSVGLIVIILVILIVGRNREGYLSSKYREVKTEKGESGHFKESFGTTEYREVKTEKGESGQFKYSYGNTKYNEISLEGLKEECNNDPECIGFLFWGKKGIGTGWTKKGVYTKNGKIIITSNKDLKSYLKNRIPCKDLSSDDLKKIPAIKNDAFLLNLMNKDDGCKELYKIYKDAAMSDYMCEPNSDKFYTLYNYNLYDVCKKTCKKCDIGHLPKATTATTNPTPTKATTATTATTNPTPTKATTATKLTKSTCKPPPESNRDIFEDSFERSKPATLFPFLGVSLNPIIKN